MNPSPTNNSTTALSNALTSPNLNSQVIFHYDSPSLHLHKSSNPIQYNQIKSLYTKKVSLPKPHPVNTFPFLHLPHGTPQTNRLHPPRPSQQSRIRTRTIHDRIQQTQRIRLRIIVRDRIVRLPRPIPRFGNPVLPEEQTVQCVHGGLVLLVRRERQLAPRDGTHLAGLAAFGNARGDARRLFECRPLAHHIANPRQPRLGLVDREVLHTINGRGVRLGNEGTGVLATQILHGAGEIVIELFQLEPDGETLELPLELASRRDVRGGGGAGFDSSGLVRWGRRRIVVAGLPAQLT
mmetsp:Transcript_3583/g.4564  ORF Transcript_3583/g.4564 Transcript_3583/m.4564 type:complete len:294 (-) Transcript_3583:118-999(-)